MFKSDETMQPVRQELNGKKLRRFWWSTPLTMTLWMVGLFYAVTCFFIIVGASRYYPVSVGQALHQAGWVPLGIALFFSLCGLGRGRSNSAKAIATLGSAFGASMVSENHHLARRVHTLADKLGLPNPAVGTMRVSNAYAVGANVKEAAVIIGAPLIESLKADELDAVIGHELGHIITGDMRRMQMTEGYQAMFVDAVHTFLAISINSLTRTRLGNMLGQMFAVMFRNTLFVGTELIVKRLSRSREFYADAIGAILTSKDAMVGALRTLHATPDISKAEMKYSYLMLRGGGSFGHLFSTHPTLEKRIDALEHGIYIKEFLGKARSVAVPDDLPSRALLSFKPKVSTEHFMARLSARGRLASRAIHTTVLTSVSHLVIPHPRNFRAPARALFLPVATRLSDFRPIIMRLAYPIALVIFLIIGFRVGLAIF